LRYNQQTMNKTTPVTRALEDLGISYQLHVHERPLRSLEQAAEERGLEPDQIVRSLLFRLEGGSFVLVLMPGMEKVNWAKLRRYLGVSRMTTATPEEVRNVTGYETGAVSPFGLPQPLRLLADRRILTHEDISIGAGIRNAGVILKRQDLLDVLEPELGDFGG
jgi:Cys-tRNA(Pro)/Cys-tRNA(Cys) deacylase